MVSIFAFNGGSDAMVGDDEEIELATPDASERSDLGRHIDRCALRYRMIAQRQKATVRAITEMRFLLWAVIVIVALSSPLAQKIFTFVFGGH